jgi:tRNA-modifying protein YgfZ
VSSLAEVRTDYQAVTEGCGLLDRSERGKLALTGPEATAVLQGQVSNDVEALSPGSGCYATFLTPKGKMLGDVRILATADELLLDTERSTLQALFNLVRRALVGYQAELHKRTLERALVSLVGPQSASVAGLPGFAESPEHSHDEITLGNVSARAIRTDVGVDLLCHSDQLGALRSVLRSLGARDVSEESVECLRVERGRPRYGFDLDDSVIPEEAGLNERAVSFSKGCYVGQETVARLHWRGKPNRHLRGIRLSAPACTGDALVLGERQVGRLGTVVTSPRFGPIALALVRREAEPGSHVTVGETSVPATVVELPFSDRPAD